MERLTGELSEQFRKSEELERKIKENLAGFGYKLHSQASRISETFELERFLLNSYEKLNSQTKLKY